jgi:hypothetical protein
MLLLTLLACQSPGDPVHALVLSGWEYDWELLSHRVSLLRVDLQQSATADLALVGGSYTTGEDASDTPNYRIGWSDIGVPGATFTEANGEWVVGPEGTSTAALTVEAPESCENVTAYLNGFSIETDIPQSADYPADYDPALGYTSNGFGFSLSEPTNTDGVLAVDVTASIRWAPQDREDMNAAIPFAQTGVSARVLFACYAGDAVTMTVSGSADYPFEPAYTEQPPMTAPVEIAGVAPDGVLGNTGFNLDAAFTNVDGSDAGDYLRSFGVELTGADDGEGNWRGTTTAQITNSSLIEFGDLLASFSASYARIGVRGSITEMRTIEGTHTVGETTINLE